eukprot:5520252-Pleurochrysis_carterae.AAC.4
MAWSPGHGLNSMPALTKWPTTAGASNGTPFVVLPTTGQQASNTQIKETLLLQSRFSTQQSLKWIAVASLTNISSGQAPGANRSPRLSMHSPDVYLNRLRDGTEAILEAQLLSRQQARTKHLDSSSALYGGNEIAASAKAALVASEAHRRLAPAAPYGEPHTPPPKRTFKLLVPGHGRADRSATLLRSIAHVSRGLPVELDFVCHVFVYNAQLAFEDDGGCFVTRRAGLWTDFLKLERLSGPSDFVAVMIDDVSPVTLDVHAFVSTMEAAHLDLASASAPGWHWQ